jgi:hypothetical protein
MADFWNRKATPHTAAANSKTIGERRLMRVVRNRLGIADGSARASAS